MSNYIDTRTLIEERDNLSNDILQAWNEYQEENLNNEYGDCDDFDDVMQVAENLKDNGSLDFLITWENEIREVREINEVEDEVGSEFDYGAILIDEDDFEEYIEELLKDCGYISDDFPSWIEIDWEATAKNVKQDYSELTFRGTNYLFRA